jgi:hypothetical protein
MLNGIRVDTSGLAEIAAGAADDSAGQLGSGSGSAGAGAPGSPGSRAPAETAAIPHAQKDDGLHGPDEDFAASVRTQLRGLEQRRQLLLLMTAAVKKDAAYESKSQRQLSKIIG